MKENNWKTAETLARTVVTLETERIKLVQSSDVYDDDDDDEIFEKFRDIKCNKNPFHGKRVVPLGRTGRQTDVKNLMVSFRRSANAPKYWLLNIVSFITMLNLSVRKTVSNIPVALSFL